MGPVLWHSGTSDGKTGGLWKHSSLMSMSSMSGGPMEDEKLPNTVLGELPLTRQLDEEELSRLGMPPIAGPRSNDEEKPWLFGKVGRPWGRPSGRPYACMYSLVGSGAGAHRCEPRALMG